VALFLVDQRMPGLTGTEFLQEARKVYPDAKKVLLTAYADTDAAISAINEVGLHHYLMKPWDPPEERLFPTLDDLLLDWSAHARVPFEGVRVVGSRWSPQSYAVRDFLSRNQVPYEWVDVDHDAPTRDSSSRSSAISPACRWSSVPTAATSLPRATQHWPRRLDCALPPHDPSTASPLSVVVQRDWQAPCTQLRKGFRPFS
jgi:CheY-like chemotaxis protein